MSTTVSHSKTPPADARAAESEQSAWMPTLPPAEDGGDEGKKNAGSRAQTQRIIWKGYEAVARGEEVSFAHIEHIDGGKGLDISAVIQVSGMTQWSFPLPNGETTQKAISIGLPVSCSNPRLLSMSNDAEGRGVWLEITGKKGGVTTTTHILLTSKEDVTGPDALVYYGETRERALTAVRMSEGYEQAKRQGRVSFTDFDEGKGLDISAVIGGNGTTQRSFPLPNGETIKATLGIGLPEPCSNPRLLSMSTDTEGRGVWLKITGKNDKGDPQTTHILLTSKERVTGPDALVDYKVTKEDSPLVRRIREEYEQTKTKGHVSFTDIDGVKGLDISEVIAGNGATQKSFPLPNGETTKKNLRIGLPASCSNPRLLSMSIDGEGRGVWLEITGENAKGDPKTKHILFTATEGVTGRDALVCYGETRERALTKKNASSRAQTQDIICEGYQAVARGEEVSFTDDGGEGLDISAVIRVKGTTQNSFPLANGKTIKAGVSIGLPEKCSNPRLLSMSNDAEGRGVWLKITGEDDKGALTTTHILLNSKEGVTGPDAVVCYGETRERALTAVRISEGYEQAKTKGHFSFTDDGGEGLDISAVIRVNGWTQKSFPLPNGKTIKETLRIGLPRACSNPRLLSMSIDGEGRGVWLEITGKKGGVITTTHILLTSKEGDTGHAALVCYGATREHALTKKNAASRAQTQDIICEGYQAVARGEEVSFTDDGGEGLDISAVIAGNGTTQNSFPLANGKTIKAQVGIGLPVQCSNPRLLSMSNDAEGRGVWLKITGEDDKGALTTTHILLTSKEGVTHHAALVCYGATREHALTAVTISEGYEQAKTKGRVSFTHIDEDKGLDISAVIGVQGYTNNSLPLPNGDTIKAQVSIGLPKECSNPRLLSIKYDKEQDLYSLYITAEQNGFPRETILVLKGEQGLIKKDAIHSYTGDLSDDPPLAFRKRIEEGRKCARKLATFASRKAGAAGSIAYTKGQCFEQLVGVLLAAQYPTERVLPQYCLKVDESMGYYGMRVDFKVGSKLFFEVKWGLATQNIHDTHRSHTGTPGVDESHYNVITLCKNDELSVPYTLFSALAETHPLRDELNEAMARIASLVRQGEEAGKQDKEERRRCVLNLEAVRDYLYDMFHRVGTNEASLLSGEQRIEFLRSALRFLNDTPEEALVRELYPKISRHWTSLEAYWEIGEKVLRSLIPVHQLVEEEPQEYDLGFCYQREFYEEEEADYTLRPFATFRDIEDFKLLFCLDDTRTGDERFLCHIPGSIAVTGEKDEHGWFVKPVFTILVGDTKLSLSRYPLGDDVTQVTTSQELSNIAQKNGLIPPQDMSALDRIVDDATPYLGAAT